MTSMPAGSSLAAGVVLLAGSSASASAEMSERAMPERQDPRMQPVPPCGSQHGRDALTAAQRTGLVSPPGRKTANDHDWHDLRASRPVPIILAGASAGSTW